MKKGKGVLCFLLVAVLAMMLVFAMSSVALATDGEGDYYNDYPPEIYIDGAAVIGVVIAMFVLATILEELVEIIKNKIDPKKLEKWVWFLITSGAGILLCVLFGVNLLAALGFYGSVPALYVGRIITGIGVGAGSGVVHLIIDKIKAAKNITNGT